MSEPVKRSTNSNDEISESVSVDHKPADILNELSAHPTIATALNESGKAFLFQTKNVVMGKLLLDLKQPAKEEPSDCENLKLNFSLPSGNYYLHGVARTLGNGKFMFHPGDRIVRLQRRRHFRANIPSEFDLTFCVTAINLEIKPVDLRVFDISGSGISFLIRDTPSRLQFKIGDVIHGQIKEDGKRILTLTCHVRHCLPGPEGFEKVGLEFLGLDRKDEQRLIVLSLRVYRHGSPNSFQDEA